MWNTISCYRLLAIDTGLIITQNELTSDKFEQHVNGILTTVSRVMTQSFSYRDSCSIFLRLKRYRIEFNRVS